MTHPPISKATPMAPAVTDGILVADKPAGLSSTQALGRVKRILGIKKAGHAGTLDPFATGVIVCAIGQATRLTRFLLTGRKTYAAVMRLGIDTDTQDLTGSVMAERPTEGLNPERIRDTGLAFSGTIQQTPPIFSALKHQGTPLYRLARKGTPVHKPPRPVTIHRLEIQAIDIPWVHFNLTCSAGTYVRTICADWGSTLGCGAHLHALRRTAASGFTLDEAVALDTPMTAEALARHMIPMVDALRHIPVVRVDADLAAWIRCGRPLATGDLPEPAEPLGGDLRQIQDHHHQLVAVVQQEKCGQSYTYCCVFNK